MVPPTLVAQARPGPEVFHVGGFSDAAFDVLADFAQGGKDADFWVKDAMMPEHWGALIITDSLLAG